jgi:hypothetical protein
MMIVQDTLDGWMKCQRSWMYLEPIFASDDIRKKMPLEHKKFEGIDRTFRQVMDHFNKDPQMWEGIDSDKLKNEFDLNNKYNFHEEPWTPFKNPSRNIWRPSEERSPDSSFCPMINSWKFWPRPKIQLCNFFNF